MATAKKTTEFKLTFNQPLSKVWSVIANNGPKAFVEMVPEVFSSIEGPWRVPGATVSIKYKNGLPDCKCTFEEVNDEEYFTKVRVVEEGNKSRYHMHSCKLLPGPSSNSTLALISLEDDADAQAFKETYTRALEILNSRIDSHNICN